MLRKALVTGATGFIGRRLSLELLKKGWNVKILVRPESKYSDLKKAGANIITGDIKELDTVKKAIENVNYVFNLAAVLPNHQQIESVYWSVNVEGLRNIIEASSISQKIKIIQVSTVGIYARSLDIYGKTKIEAEKLLKKHSSKGYPIVIIRPTICYGPGDTRPGFLDLFRLVKKGIFIPIGKGDNFFHTIYVDNLVDALILVSHKKAAEGEDFIIGDDPCPTMKEILEIVYNVFRKKTPRFYIPKNLALLIGYLFDLIKPVGIKVPLSSRRVKFITENKKFKISKAKEMLGYKPKVDLVTGMKETLKWYQENRLL